MHLTPQELTFLRNVLRAERAYRGMDIPHGVNLWPDWKEVFYEKVLNEQNKSTTLPTRIN